MPVARLCQRSRVAAWREFMEHRSHMERTAWSTYVAQAVAGGKDSWEEWQIRMGLLDNRPTKAEKGEVMSKVLMFLPPGDPDRERLLAQGVREAPRPAGRRRRPDAPAPSGASPFAAVTPLERVEPPPEPRRGPMRPSRKRVRVV